MSYNTCNPYLFFNGECKEALLFYKEALGAKLEMSTYGDSPMDVPDAYKDKIIHGWLSFDKINIMASDTMPGQEVERSNDSAINLNIISEDLGQTIFDKLSKDGAIVMPFEKTFWGAIFGVVNDKFGVQWMVNVDNKK